MRLSGTLTLPSAASASSVVNVAFALYKEETGGTSLWQETQNVEVDATGHYTVLLGTTQSEGLPIELFTSGQAQWLGVRLQGEPEQARIMLVSVPFALKAGDAETIGGLSPSAFVLATGSQGAARSAKPATASNAAKNSSKPANPNVTGVGTVDYIPMWDTASDIMDSIIFQKSSEIGIATTTPAATLDVNGTTDVRDTLTLYPKGTDNTLAINGTAFKIDQTGKMTFISGQTFPGTGTIAGSGTANYIPLWSNSSNLAISPLYQQGLYIGYGTTTPAGPLDIRGGSALFAISGLTTNPKSAGVFGFNDQNAGEGFGLLGNTSSSIGGAGVYGLASSTTGLVVGVDGQTNSSEGAGVFGVSSEGIGVEGQTAGVSHYGGLFINQNTQTFQNSRAIALGALTGANGGIALNSVAVQGSVIGQQQTQVTGKTLAVWGDTNQTGGLGVLGTADDGNAVVGLNSDPALAAGAFTNYNTTTNGAGIGVYGTTSSPNGSGVYGFVNSATAIGVTGDNDATSGVSVGVYGTAVSPSGAGVQGQNTDTTGTGEGGVGVFGGTSSPNGVGVFGINTGSGIASGYGVYGSSATNVGILGVCAPTNPNSCFNGIAGLNTSISGGSNGVWGLTASPEGSAAYLVNAGGGDLLFGTQSDGGSATFYVQGNGSGYFAGNLDVVGAITAGTKDFKIDHPLDPANKYLVHASVESSEMMNIYTGNITTDGEGMATVLLPDWFEALNRDFRYQLTVMGQFAQAIVADEVANHQFRVKTDKPNVKVSWQVTGIRQDAFANAHRIQVEVEKAPEDRGHYLHPELFGASKEARISHRSGSGAGQKIPAIHPLPVKAARASQALNAPSSGKVLLPPPMPRVLPAPTMPKALTSVKAEK
jgi:hypothetical protein